MNNKVYQFASDHSDHVGNEQQASKQITATSSIPLTGFLRLFQIIGNKDAGIPAIIPVSKSTWWAGITSGRYPKPVKLSERAVAWKVEDIRALVKQLSDGGRDNG